MANRTNALVDYDKLNKILQHELQLGCTNKAVITGLETFVVHWQDESLARGVGEDDHSQILGIVEALSGYSELNPADRARVLTGLLERLGTAARTDFKPLPAVVLNPEAASAPAGVTPAAEAPSGAVAAGTVRLARPLVRERRAPAPAPAVDLTRPITDVRGINSITERKFNRLGVETVEDLLNFFPRRYVDYSALKTIDQLFYGEEVTVIGTVTQKRIRETRRGITIFEIALSDDTGSIQATWFNNPYLMKRLAEDQQIALSGKVEEYLGKLVFQSPDWEPIQPEMLHTGRLRPTYRLTEGLFPRQVRTIVKAAVDFYALRLEDYLPLYLRQRVRVLDLPTAMYQIHFPDNPQTLERARRRLAFDEFLLIQLGVLRQRQKWQSVPAAALAVDSAAFGAFESGLAYSLTGAQKRAIQEIKSDLAKPVAMSRMLQGDVGSGKTVVAAAAMAIAVANGKQVAIMAPTEILAEQHYRTFARLFANSNTQVRLLTGSVTKREKEAIKAEIASGTAGIAVGTHALIQDDVVFMDLGLVVVDEQHRFGVRQRAALRQKGWNPHMLVMTATPIPRTLSLTLYGDLDLSVLDELPPGRQPILTKVRKPLERERTYTLVRSQVQAGRQAFIICPLVEESDKLESKAAIEEHARLQRDIFPDLKLGLLHGRMKGKEKEEVMRAFLNRETDILVSTSVVEVGIDVPNATVMLVEGANRFGLSQLHQFRGRVGRGEFASYCFLLADADSSESSKRLSVIEESQDGFRLAEEDLKLRGPGEFFGTRQSGLPDLKVALLSDVRVLEDARREAQDIFARDPLLQQHEHQALAQRVRTFWRGEGDLS
jgi:ATP-dependent DNA helicase RecG